MNDKTAETGKGGDGAAPVVQTPATARKAADPVKASVQTARDMIENGQGADYAADWLARQCPDAFKDAAAAKAAISQ